jgi:hypothetical protein
MDLKVGIIRDEGMVETFGWISNDMLMVRSPDGAVWVQLNGDGVEGVPKDSGIFDVPGQTASEYESEDNDITDDENPSS